MRCIHCQAQVIPGADHVCGLVFSRQAGRLTDSRVSAQQVSVSGNRTIGDTALDVNSWRAAGAIVAQQALQAMERDEFETAAALRVLAVTAYQMEDLCLNKS